MTRDVHLMAADRLEAEGQRYTDQRRQLVETCRAPDNRSTIPDILRGHGGRASFVYRNLAALEQAGVVWRVATDEEYGRYELKARSLTRHHHHLICRSCGRVEDVTIPGDLEQRIDRTLDRVARKSGFATVAHRLDLIGICRDCAAASMNGASAPPRTP